MEKEKEKQMSIKNAEEALAASRKRLEEFNREKQRIETGLQLAAKTADAAALVALRQGLRDLNDLAFPAQISSLKADLALQRAKIEALQPQITAAELAWENARQARLDLQASLKSRGSHCENAMTVFQNLALVPPFPSVQL